MLVVAELAEMKGWILATEKLFHVSRSVFEVDDWSQSSVVFWHWIKIGRRTKGKIHIHTYSANKYEFILKVKNPEWMQNLRFKGEVADIKSSFKETWFSCWSQLKEQLTIKTKEKL